MPRLRTLWFLLPFCLGLSAAAQRAPSPIGAIVAHRFLVAFRPAPAIPGVPGARLAGLSAGEVPHLPGVRLLHYHPDSLIAVVETSPGTDDAVTLASLRAQPGVEFALHDRVVSAHALRVRPVPALVGLAPGAAAPYDTYYTSTPQSWAVLQSGGYGAGVPGGPASGPWDTTEGSGVRIAILDSGIDRTHPDLAPNLAFSISEVDQSPLSGLPSPCDDGSPQDQQGHGTWTASLAAAAIGPGTGLLVGVAPHATLLNIKVLERMPDPSSTSADVSTQCATGQASGLLSWIVQGIEEAVAQHANIVSLSLGTLADLDTGEGAGLQATFDRVTYAAAQAGAVLVASAGNDGVDLSDPRFLELPAQARSVLAVVASTNPACAENLNPGASCTPGPVALPYYSNFGLPLNAIAAPGGSLPAGPDTGVSGWILGACSTGLPDTSNGPPSDSSHSLGCFNLGHTPYVQAMGTSASAPLVAGAAALLRAAHPTWTAEQILAALRSSSSRLVSLSAAPLLNPAALAGELTAAEPPLP